MRLDRTFNISGRNYIFDGNTLDIYEVDKNDHTMLKDSPTETEKVPGENTFLRTLVLNLTNNCNLTCGYCYAKQGKYNNSGIKMSHETAYNGIDLLIDSVIKNNGNIVTIAFFGGEPLLAFDLIQKIVKYTRKKIPDNILTRYLITTNGTCLTKKQANFFQKNNFKVMLSIDGNPKMHNMYRIYPDGHGSYQDTIQAVNLLLNRVPIEARITVANKNTDITKAVSHIQSLGIKRITYALDYYLSNENFSKFIRSLKQLFAYYTKMIQKKQFFDLSNITEPISTIVLKKKKKSHCNAGISYLSLSADGYIYRCPRFTDNKLFSFGTIKENDSIKIAERIRNFKYTLGGGTKNRNSDCANCCYVYLCGGICYHHSYLITSDEFNTITRECYYRDQLYSQVIEMLCTLNIAERREFLLFLSQFWQNERR